MSSERERRPRVSNDDLEYIDVGYVHYQGVPFTGEAVELADDGIVVELHTYREGREHGPQREWFDDGDIRSEYYAVGGLPFGESRDWHPNGQLARRQEFDEYGVLRRREVWNEDGVPQSGQAVDSW